MFSLSLSCFLTHPLSFNWFINGLIDAFLIVAFAAIKTFLQGRLSKVDATLKLTAVYQSVSQSSLSFFQIFFLGTVVHSIINNLNPINISILNLSSSKFILHWRKRRMINAPPPGGLSWVIWARSYKKNQSFRAIGFFKEADTLESSSILIYSELQTGLYTQLVWREAT